MPVVATIATSNVIRIQAADMRASNVVIKPTPEKERNSKVPCSSSLTVMGKFALLRYLSEF